MKNCSVPNCTVLKEFKDQGLHLRSTRFPKNVEMQKKWLRAIGRKDLESKLGGTLYTSYRVCEAHFHPNDLQPSFPGVKSFRMLKLWKNPVPVYNLRGISIQFEDCSNTQNNSSAIPTTQSSQITQTTNKVQVQAVESSNLNDCMTGYSLSQQNQQESSGAFDVDDSSLFSLEGDHTYSLNYAKAHVATNSNQVHISPTQPVSVDNLNCSDIQVQESACYNIGISSRNTNETETLTTIRAESEVLTNSQIFSQGLNSTASLSPAPSQSQQTSTIKTEKDDKFGLKRNGLLKRLNVSRVSYLTPKERFLYFEAKRLERRCANAHNETKRLRKALREVRKTKKELQMDGPAEGVNELTWKFLTSQLQLASKKARGRRFTIEDKILCLQLFKQSPQGYEMLRQLLPLPSTKTLKNLINDMSLETETAVTHINTEGTEVTDVNLPILE